MQPERKRYRPGQWVFLGTVLGAFIGLLFGKFALGLIFGFFVGVAIDSVRRRAPKPDGGPLPQPPETESRGIPQDQG